MTTIAFEYRAFTRDGVETKGLASAPSRSDAYRQLVAQGLTPTAVEPAGRSVSILGRSKAIGTKDLAHFTYQFGVLLSASIPIADGLRSIAQQERAGPLRDLILDLASRIQSGETICAAMEAHRAELGQVYVDTIRAAEKTGSLPTVLEHLSEMLERSLETSRQVRSAMMYPVCVVAVLVLAVTFLVGFVIPKFAAMFAKHGAELPLFTKLLMNLGVSMQSYWWAYLGTCAIAAGCLKYALSNESGRLRLDRLMHRIPYIRRILVGIGIARFSRILGLSLSSGLSLIESLHLAGRASGRPMLAAEATVMAEKVRAGSRLSQVLAECGYLTPFAKRMLAAGEQSTDIPRMCTVVSRHYEREGSDLTKNLSTVIEPLLVVSIAGVVLVIAMAIFLPMWDSMKLVG